MVLQEALVLLLGALLLGSLFNRFRQDAVLGYLLAGALCGPHAFGLIANQQVILIIAELGVALLLFAIGMEFSWSKLRQLGPKALLAGSLQLALSTLLGGAVSLALGFSTPQSIAIGATIALSSTALVTRLLVERSRLDSAYGRSALGILLLQDVAVVPLVLIVTALGGGANLYLLSYSLLKTALLGVLLVGGLFVLLRFIFPKLVSASSTRSNRDLPALLAAVTAIGCAWSAHALGISPLLGSFAGGVVLAGSPYGAQVRSDLTPLRAVFATLFFSSIGTLTDPSLLMEYAPAVLSLTATVIVGKSIVVWLSLRLAGRASEIAFAAALCLGQVGEFSFILLDISYSSELIDRQLFDLLVTVVTATLFLTPLLLNLADRSATTNTNSMTIGSPKLRPDIQVAVIGFGPAGQACADSLQQQGYSVLVVDWEPHLCEQAQSRGFSTVCGDATRLDVLEEAGLAHLRTCGLTVPDPKAAEQIAAQCRSLSPKLHLVVRGRYQKASEDLTSAGADFVADEEGLVGRAVSLELKKKLSAESQALI